MLAAGVLLAVGCGEEEEVDTAPADALARQLDAERALAAATVRRRDPRVREISTRARDRAAKLAAALTAEGGRPGEPPQPSSVPDDEAVALAQAAIVAHVVALPSMSGDLRELGTEMVIGAAADTALLGDALGVPVHDPFPGTPR